MSNLSYHRHRFPVEIIQHAVWLYYRFPLSFRDVEDILAERGIDVSYEALLRWVGQVWALLRQEAQKIAFSSRRALVS